MVSAEDMEIHKTAMSETTTVEIDITVVDTRTAIADTMTTTAVTGTQAVTTMITMTTIPEVVADPHPVATTTVTLGMIV